MQKNTTVKLVALALMALVCMAYLASSQQRSSQGSMGGGMFASINSWFNSVFSTLMSAMSYMLFIVVLLNPCVYGTGSPAECDLGFVTMPQDVTVKYFNIMFLKMFIPWFILIFILLGIYLIFMQGSPSGRAEAKAMFIDTVVGLFLVSFSPMIFQTLLDISQAVSWNMFTTLDKEVINNWFSGGGMSNCLFCCFAQIYLLLFVLAFLVALLRYLVVLICAILWPLGLFLYSFTYTKGLGNLVIKFSIIAIFSQLIQVFLLATAFALASGGGGGSIGNMLLMGAALLLFIIFPMKAMKILGWLGGIMWMHSARGGEQATRYIGALAMGQSPGQALVTATSRWSIRQQGGPFGAMGMRLPMWQQPFSDADATGAGKVIGESYSPIDQYYRSQRQPEGMAGSGFYGATGESLGGVAQPMGDSASGAGASCAGAAPARPAEYGGASSTATRRARRPIPIRGATTPQSPAKEGGGYWDSAATETPFGGQPAKGEEEAPGGGGSRGAKARAEAVSSDEVEGTPPSAAEAKGQPKPRERKSDKVSAAEAALKRAQAGLAAAQKLAPTGGGRRPPAPLSGRDSARKVAGLPKEAGRPPVTIGGRDVKDVGVLSERSSKEKPEEPPPKDEAKPQSGDDEETGE